MFSGDGFLTDKFANKGQTHLFTSFPNSAVDPDDDLPSEIKSTNDQLYGYNPSDSGQSSLPLPVTAGNTKSEPFRIWQIEYYQKYFQIDTQQVLERLVASITPRPNTSYFNSTIRQNPDLYGPFWVCVTFIVTVAISGNILTYFNVPNTDFQIDFSKITLSAIVSKTKILCKQKKNQTFFCLQLICLYWWLMPTCVYFFFHWHLKRIEYTFIELLCIYGYSLTIFIPISILWMIPITWLQWLLTIISSLISGSVLIVAFWPTINSGEKRFNALSMLVVLLAHLLMAICIMLVFFHTSDKNINLEKETTMASLTNSKV
jgi:hypothetical protein